MADPDTWEWDYNKDQPVSRHMPVKSDSKPARPTCERCKFWDNAAWVEAYAGISDEEEEDRRGYCRARSPGYRGFPITDKTDWCGEFKAREQRVSDEKFYAVMTAEGHVRISQAQYEIGKLAEAREAE